jgi:hypothetical protein
MQHPLLGDGFANKHVCTVTVGNSNRGTTFSVRSVQKRCMQESWSNELVVRQSQAGENVSTEAEDIVGICHQATTDENTAE